MIVFTGSKGNNNNNNDYSIHNILVNMIGDISCLYYKYACIHTPGTS